MSYAIKNKRLARRMTMSSKSGGGRGRSRRRGWGSWGDMPMGPGFPGRGGAKVRRGDVRSAILYLLDEKPMHGYQIMQELSDRTNGAWRPSAGSVYPNLQQLEDEDLVVASDATGKKVFELTDSGREAVESDSKGPPWERFETHEAYASLKEAGFGVAHAVTQVARTGTEAQLEKTREILEEARRQIYQLLADDEE